MCVQVKELIRNSPRIGHTPLRETQATSGLAAASHDAVKMGVPPVKGKGRKRSASENWLEHVPSSTVESGKGGGRWENGEGGLL